MKKLFSVILLFFLTCFSVQAKSITKNINSIISNSEISGDKISISVKNCDNGKVVYAHNDKILLHPASVQKLLTIVPAVEILGSEYEFSTQLYSRGNDEYLLKLSADPYLTYKDLIYLAANVDKTAKKLYVDDSVIEKKSWGEGWQWDDDLNVSMPHFNAYNLDKNLMKITVMPTDKSNQTIIINQNKSPITFINNVQKGDKNSVAVTRDNATMPNIISLSGTVKIPQVIIIPIDNNERYFNAKLTSALEEKKVYIKEPRTFSKVKSTDTIKAEIKHPVNIAINDILVNSNNISAETLVKVAASKAYGKTGTDMDGIKLFRDFCKKNQLDDSGIKLVDASGVSKNNLVSTDFVSEFLVKNKNNETLSKMAVPGSGTLVDRMLPLKNNLKAKTGTLSDISSIAGFLETKKGNHYAFSIIINDPASSASDKKLLEDYLIRAMYLKM